jgi:IstB-like ATP binding protein
VPVSDGERLPYLVAKLKAPRIAERLATTAERARAEGWAYEAFLEALLEAEVFARDASGARQRIRSAGFPALKSLEDFDWAAQPSAERPLVEHLAQLTWISEAANVCFLGPPGTGKTHCENGFSGPGRSLPGCTGGPGMTPKIHWPWPRALMSPWPWVPVPWICLPGSAVPAWPPLKWPDQKPVRRRGGVTHHSPARAVPSSRPAPARRSTGKENPDGDAGRPGRPRHRRRHPP